MARLGILAPFGGGAADAVYAVVRRTIDSQTVRYVERLAEAGIAVEGLIVNRVHPSFGEGLPEATRARAATLADSVDDADPVTGDGVTGLATHGYLQERLADEVGVAATADRPVAFALVKLRSLGATNAAAGHAAGDYVLREVARRDLEALAQGLLEITDPEVAARRERGVLATLRRFWPLLLLVTVFLALSGNLTVIVAVLALLATVPISYKLGRRLPVRLERRVWLLPVVVVSNAPARMLIERFGSLGGNMTLGLNTKPSGSLSGGLPLDAGVFAGLRHARFVLRPSVGYDDVDSPPFFPVDNETLNYLRFSGREEALIDLVEKYCREQQLFRTDDRDDLYLVGTSEVPLAGLHLDEIDPHPRARGAAGQGRAERLGETGNRGGRHTRRSPRARRLRSRGGVPQRTPRQLPLRPRPRPDWRKSNRTRCPAE